MNLVRPDHCAFKISPQGTEFGLSDQKVLHFHSAIFQRTESFIYTLLSGFRQWQPVLDSIRVIGCRGAVSGTN